MLVKSCVTKSYRKMTSAVQLAAGSKQVKSVMRISDACPVLFASVCLGISIRIFRRELYLTGSGIKKTADFISLFNLN